MTPEQYKKVQDQMPGYFFSEADSARGTLWYHVTCQECKERPEVLATYGDAAEASAAVRRHNMQYHTGQYTFQRF